MLQLANSLQEALIALIRGGDESCFQAPKVKKSFTLCMYMRSEHSLPSGSYANGCFDHKGPKNLKFRIQWNDHGQFIYLTLANCNCLTELFCSPAESMLSIALENDPQC